MTSNKGFGERGEVPSDEVMAAALIDRILDHCHIVNIRGNSYRIRQHTEICRAPRHGADEPSRRTRKTGKEAREVRWGPATQALPAMGQAIRYSL